MTTKPGDVPQQVVEIWATQFQSEYREKHVLANLTDMSYQASFNQSNDTAKISQYNAGDGEDLAIDVDSPQNDTACEFNPSPILTQQVELKINRRAVSSREFCDLTSLLSQVKPEDMALRATMGFEVSKVINKRLYSTVSATSNTGSTASISATTLSALAKQADGLFWPEQDRWLLLDSEYYEDLLNATTLVDVSATGSGDRPTIAGQFVQQRFGWNIVKDTSVDMKAQLNGGTAGVALAMTREHLLWASPFGDAMSRIQISNQHANRKFGFVMSIDQPFGVALGNDGAAKAIIIRSGS